MKLFSNFEKECNPLIQELMEAKNKTKLASDSIDELLKNQEYSVCTKYEKDNMNKFLSDISLNVDIRGDFHHEQVSGIINIMLHHGFIQSELHHSNGVDEYCLKFYKSIKF